MGTLYLWVTADQVNLDRVARPALGARRERAFPVMVSPLAPEEVGPGDVVVVMGDDQRKALAAAGTFPRNRTIASLRGRPYPYQDGSVFVTYSPDLLEVQADAPSEIGWDLRLASRLLLTGSVDPVVGEYGWVGPEDDFFAGIVEYVNQSYEAARAEGASHGQARVPVANDLETVGYSPDYPDRDIVCVALSAHPGYSDVLLWHGAAARHRKRARQQLEWIMTTDRIKTVGANWKFDQRWYRAKMSLYCTNYAFDTLLVGSLLDENLRNSLSNHAKVYSDMGGYDQVFNDAHDKSRMDLVPPDELLPYAGGDADATRRVYDALRPQLLADNRRGDGPPAKRSLANLYVTIVHPASVAFEHMETVGMLADLNEFARLRAEVDAGMREDEAVVAEALPESLRHHHGDKLYDGDRLALTRSSVMADFLFSGMGLGLKPKVVTPKTEKASTAESHLAMFRDHPEAGPIIAAFLNWRAGHKVISTYIDGFLEHLRPDGRFHPSYFLFKGGDAAWDKGGTVTGRSSARDPAVQCMVGETEVLTRQGRVRLDDLVFRVEAGELPVVLTHDGSWRRVIGAYRNGVQPAFRVTTRHHSAVCTGNHPFLTTRGFFRTDALRPGMVSFRYGLWGGIHAATNGFGGAGLRADDCNRTGRTDACALAVPVRLRAREGRAGVQPACGRHDDLRLLMGEEEGYARAHAWGPALENVPVLGQHADQVQEFESAGLSELRRTGYLRVPAVADVRELSSRHGRVSARYDDREARQRRGIRARELLLDAEGSTGAEHPSLAPHHDRRRDTMPGRVAASIWDKQARVLPAREEGLDRGAGAEDAEAAARAGFLLDEVLSIESIGLRETFDLTIEGSHSFVADGLVVHNTIPHYGELATRLRRCFPAPPGCAVLSLDFQQGELRIIACLSGDRNMVRAYREGMDLHAITASGVMGMSLDDFLAQDADTIGELRRRGKAGNFGLVFGMSPQGYQHYAWNEFQVELSLEQAETDHDAFFATYPGIKPWHQRQIGEVHRTGQVRSPLGRVRRLPLVRSPDERARRHAERQSINAPVQATLTDMMSWSLAEIHRRWPELALFGMVHDNGLAYVPEDDVELWAGRCAEVMEHLPLAETFGWETPIGFPIDAEAGPTMGDLEKLTA